jgi:glycosyltransferase involved in cell wall biosynthesis
MSDSRFVPEKEECRPMEIRSDESRGNLIGADHADVRRDISQPQDADSLTVAAIRVSVIIPTLNEEKMIGKCLESLAESCYPLDRFEVILVDNGSTDHTLEIARSFSTRLRLTILQRPGVNISALRNLGAAAAEGEVLAFLDADCSIPVNWFENAVLHLASEYAGVIGGDYEIPEDSSWVARVWFEVGYAPKDGEVTYVPSGNMLMKSSTFRQIGGFNEAIKTSEDCELCFRAREAGFSVRLIREIAATHWSTPQTLLEFYRREVWHGTHVAKVFFQNLRAMTNFWAVAFAAYMLACVAGALIGGIQAILFHRYLILDSSVIGMFVGPFFCSIRKLRFEHGKRFWLNLLPLTLVHLAWGFARATSLVFNRSVSPRATLQGTEDDSPSSG